MAIFATRIASLLGIRGVSTAANCNCIHSNDMGHNRVLEFALRVAAVRCLRQQQRGLDAGLRAGPVLHQPGTAPAPPAADAPILASRR